MRIQTIAVKITCDACGKETDNLARADDYCTQVVATLDIEVWHDGLYRMGDICRECSEKIISFLEVNDMFSHAPRVE